MATQFQSIWIGGGSNHSNAMAEIGRLVDEGWELVQWHPVVEVTPPRPNVIPPIRITHYDVFLLKKPDIPE